MIAERIAEWRRGLTYNAATNSYRVTCEDMERLTDLCLSLDGEVKVRDSWARIVADSFAAGAAAAEGSMAPNEPRRLVERCRRLAAEEMGVSNG